MHKSFYLGMYATSPTVNKWDEAKERSFVEGIIENFPEISGLELPYWGTETIHQYSDDFMFKEYPASWDYVLACVPGNMKHLSKDIHFGLASADEDGRKRALDYYKKANEKVHKLNSSLGRKSVHKIQIVTSPSVPVKGVRSSRDSLEKSLLELLRMDWGGASLVIEHCDSSVKNNEFVKGFMSLEEEISVIENVSSSQLKMTINWGRSALEGRSSETPVQHLNTLNQKNLLSGLIFSGVCDHSEKFGNWKDNHAPVNSNKERSSSNRYGESGSLLTFEKIKESFDCIEMSQLDYIGMKVLAMPMDSAPLEERIGVNLSTYNAIMDALQD